MGVLKGVKIVEMAGIGPGPFCGMLLADLGAEIIVVDRPGADVGRPRPWELCSRGKRSITLDLKKPGAVDVFLRLIDGADALVEGMRPGVMERLGLGPDICLTRRPSLVYGRMTGYGQFGPLAQVPGHDANFIALSGALWVATQKHQRPEAPPTLLGDVAGGALYLALGVVAGILRAREDGRGQVVDAAMYDGSAHLLNLILSFLPLPEYGYSIENIRPAALGQHWDHAYECSDGKWIVIQAGEPQFYAELIRRLGLAHDQRFVKGQSTPENWQTLTIELSAIFRARSQAEWVAMLEGTETCFAPVLSPPEAALHPHAVARQIYQSVDGVLQAAPAPRFSLTPSAELSSIPPRGHHTEQVLSELGLSPELVETLTRDGALGSEPKTSADFV
ncbi:CaiB/BaiF CoA transferase family protein [Mesorhizobium australafricanum]|uniref:CaiB/BaiF CoA-transferase family protein n=1 Tax=Mesorhizobium australafricanum TaxID=3072311 RepID=A0ABU4X5S0_9HYPH|nr:CaiB/BaiF CoA-transferase family protein [Mesorhizobium sp. VK3E]MDX8442419.1 CaiB/BaiF CoA-transferase family protein [Mesorhizobium sp. VK3E]